MRPRTRQRKEQFWRSKEKEAAYILAAYPSTKHARDWLLARADFALHVVTPHHMVRAAQFAALAADDLYCIHVAKVAEHTQQMATRCEQIIGRKAA